MIIITITSAVQTSVVLLNHLQACNMCGIGANVEKRTKQQRHKKRVISPCYLQAPTKMWSSDIKIKKDRENIYSFFY